MTVLGVDVLERFTRRHPDARASIEHWVRLTREATWQNLAEARKTFPSADGVPLKRRDRTVVATVFNIRGNKYRLISSISYVTQTVLMSNRRSRAQIQVPDSYLSLVKRFPIRQIRTRREHRRALAIVRELMLRGDDDLDAGEADYLRALSHFIAEYEKSQFTLQPHRPIDVLRQLMELHNMTSGDLARLLGSHSAASMILHDRRDLSKAHIRALANHFNVSAAAFL